jgi:hypothetical protein
MLIYLKKLIVSSSRPTDAKPFVARSLLGAQTNHILSNIIFPLVAIGAL